MSHATNPADPAADNTAAVAADNTAGLLPGYLTGIDLMLTTVGDKPTYDLADHDAVGLPMIVACTSCTMTMAGAAALIDPSGSCWCADCADLREGGCV